MLWKIPVPSLYDAFCIHDREFELPNPMLDFLQNVERVHGRLHRTTDLLLGLIGDIGYEIHDYPKLGWRNSGITVPKLRAIGISTEIGNERKRFTLGHELGHALFFENRIRNFSERQTESICDEFSAQLLVPNSTLKSKYLEHEGDIELMASYFEVSVECMRLCIISRTGLNRTS